VSQVETALVVLLLQIFLSTTAFANSQWPAEVIQQLEKWQNITSISHDESGPEITNVFTKRWEFSDANGIKSLTEQLPLSQHVELNNPADFSQGGTIHWVSSTINLSENISVQPFVLGDSTALNSLSALQIDQKRIVLTFNDNQGKVKFKVSLLQTSPATPGTNRFSAENRHLLGIIQTPDFGQTIGNVMRQRMFGISIQDFPGPRYYLNHPIENGRRRIIISPEFPDSYLPVLNKVIKKWNTLFGRNYYSFFKKEKLNMVDCLSSDLLCIQWTGGARFTWTQYSGTTDLAADPGSGHVLGGVIYIHNNADLKKAREGTPEELSKLMKPSNLFDVAISFSKFAIYSTIWREKSDDLVEGMLLHEMGHFLGWDHNYAGAWRGTLNSPGDTVMGYPPFLLAGRLNNLGSLDMEKFRALYFLNSQSITSPYCGDLDIGPILNKETGLASKRIPECFMWTTGNTADWLTFQATIFGNLGTTFGYGVFQLMNPPSWFGSYAVSLGYIAQNSNSAENRRKATEHLCRQRARDTALLGILHSTIQFAPKCQ
jgi:hypothetical protein